MNLEIVLVVTLATMAVTALAMMRLLWHPPPPPPAFPLSPSEGLARHEILRLSGVLDHSLDGWWDWEIRDGRETYSDRWFGMLGYSRGDFENPDSPDVWRSIIKQEDLGPTLELFKAHVDSRGAVPFWTTVTYKHGGGGEVTVLCRGHVVEWEGDAPIRMVGTHTLLRSSPWERLTDGSVTSTS